ncbi:gluconate:H+ symporter [Streptomyces sp. NPDC127098]|uniref:GntT/GntP/DsdX family permease n=1 Tax=Streptomyces sp. NPDC127098 TaxID=3347137 RepID=UPI0036697677
MSDTGLLLTAAGGVAALLLLIIKGRVQPFVALVVVSVAVALAAGVPADELVSTVEEGMGSTLGHIATIIALGAMIGRLIELSGGAHAFARSLIDRFGARRTPLALTSAGFILGIPVFVEVGMIILMPIAYGVARTSRRPLLVYALPMCAALLTVHAFLPPHPGAVAVAETIGADQGLVLLMGLPITAIVVAVGYLISRRITRREYPMDPALRASVYDAEETATDGTDGERPPSFGMVLTLVVTPIALILLGTLAENFLAEGSYPRAVLTVLGAPLVALLVDVALCGYFLGIRRGWDRARVGEVMASAVPGVAMVILIAGAGGMFGKVLVASGIGDAVADLLDKTGLPALALGFLMTMALRAAQGSTTVALITTAGILTPLLERGDLSTAQLSLVALAMGAGGLAVSHINDAGYWMFTRLTGLDVSAGLRTWTVLTTLMGATGFALTAAVWPLL